MLMSSPYSRGTLTILVSLVLLSAGNFDSPLIAGTTGKISGSIQDVSTVEPLIGANIIINGTSL